uniref:Rx N-terminal domain-containing protein n=1 Tax=Oryza barthii TaxID=65489 RepID=A0A0D3GPN2_9ORYZ
MAEAVASALVQETVSGVFSYLSSNRTEKASKRHNMERLEMAHSELDLALERSSKLPITDASLLRQRKIYKRAYDECGDVLHRCKLQILEGEDSHMVKGGFTKQIFRAVKSSISSLIGMDKDEASYSDDAVRRFEWFADKAGKFVRDVETGCSLAHYRFFSPLIKHLLEGKRLCYELVQRSQTLRLEIDPVRSEERGVEAEIRLCNDNVTMLTRSFNLRLILRLSESTDIVGIIISCLQSFGPHFKSLVENAKNTVAELPTQDVLNSSARIFFALPSDVLYEGSATTYRPDPLCCRTHGHGVGSLELSYRFPEQVSNFHFNGYVVASDCNYRSANSTNEVIDRNIMRDWPPLQLTIAFAPHQPHHEDVQGSYEIIGGNNERIDTSMHQMEEMVVSKAIGCFNSQPEVATYSIFSWSVHGCAYFAVQKSIVPVALPLSPGPTNSTPRPEEFSREEPY